MGAIDHLAIVTLGPKDARDGLLLSEEAHWNQNEDDWWFFLVAGTVFGVRDDDNRLIATAALLPYTSNNAWISMVLVTQNWRRRGLASRLLEACLDSAARQGLTAWLDATPAGAAVYGPLGFTPTLQLQRLRLKGQALSRRSLRPASDGSYDELVARDHRAMGFERRDLLRSLSERPGSRLVSRQSAIALIRDGREARHIGPLFSDDIISAMAVVEAATHSETSSILIDVVGDQHKFLEYLVGTGWTIERPFQRMRFGRAAAQDAEPPFAVAGPEYG